MWSAQLDDTAEYLENLLTAPGIYRCIATRDPLKAGLVYMRGKKKGGQSEAVVADLDTPMQNKPGSYPMK